MTAASSCPDAVVLERMIRGQVSDVEADDLARHVLQCDRCAAVLDRFTDLNPLLQAMRSHKATRSWPVDPVVEDLVARLSSALLPGMPAAGASTERAASTGHEGQPLSTESAAE